jgi:glycosyltransferase involved in cell wall biosynthesis
MRVALVPSTYLPSVGGVQIDTHNLAKRLNKMGIDLHILAGKKGLPSTYVVEDLNVHSLPFYLFRGTIKSFFAFLLRFAICILGGFFFFRKRKPEMVHIHFLGANAFYIMLLHMIMRFKIVVTLYGTIEAPYKDLARTEGYWEAKILNWTADRVLHQASTIVCISQYLYKKVITIFPDLEPKCKIIPIGVELPNIDQMKAERSNFILGAGRLTFEKGFDTLIKAFKKVSELFPDLKLVLAGDGNERACLERIVFSSALTDKVVFLGEVKRTRVMELLSECKLFVVPSRNEGFGGVILEAMVTGTPIVASAVGGIPELICNKETGVLVPGDSVNELTETLISLLCNKELLVHLGLQAQKAVRKKYDWDVIAGEYLQIYRQIARDPAQSVKENEA